MIKATDKYGINTTVELVDEAEEDINNITRGDGWISDGKEIAECSKNYGDRRFSYTTKQWFCRQTSRFGYTISDKGITTRYIEGDVTNIVSPMEKGTVTQEIITDSKAKAINENVDGHVRYRFTAASCLWGGADVCQTQHNMVVTIKRWDKKNKYMYVEEYAHNLTKCGG